MLDIGGLTSEILSLVQRFGSFVINLPFHSVGSSCRSMRILISKLSGCPLGCCRGFRVAEPRTLMATDSLALHYWASLGVNAQL